MCSAFEIFVCCNILFCNYYSVLHIVLHTMSSATSQKVRRSPRNRKKIKPVASTTCKHCVGCESANGKKTGIVSKFPVWKFCYEGILLYYYVILWFSHLYTVLYVINHMYLVLSQYNIFPITHAKNCFSKYFFLNYNQTKTGNFYI